MSAAHDDVRAFDSHAEDYETHCMRGLRLSGESKAYFARGRLAYLRAWWDRRGLAEPRRIVDYGSGVGDVPALLAETFPSARLLGLDPSKRCVEHATGHHASDRVEFARFDGLDAAAMDLTLFI